MCHDSNFLGRFQSTCQILTHFDTVSTNDEMAQVYASSPISGDVSNQLAKFRPIPTPSRKLTKLPLGRFQSTCRISARYDTVATNDEIAPDAGMCPDSNFSGRFQSTIRISAHSDPSRQIAIFPLVSLTQARIDMSELDEDSDGFLQPHEMEFYIRGLIPNLAQLRDIPEAFVQMYCRIAAHKFFFFCDPHKRGKACIKKVLLSNCLQELMELHQESEDEVTDTEQAENWFSLTSAQRICDMFLALDKDMNGTLSKQELQEYADGTLTDIFIERVFDEHIRRGKNGGGNAREMDFESFLDFVLALENKDSPEGLTYLFRCLDLHGRGFLTTADTHTLFRDVHQKWIEGGNYELCIEDVRDEIWDMVKPADPLRITLADLLGCKQGGTVASMLIDVRGFWAHDNRENLLQEEEEPQEEA
ncbi:probable serine threonine- phosphatase 2A regulatory subunit B subunit TON2, partial [Olea europaea subsp. europaea]